MCRNIVCAVLAFATFAGCHAQQEIPVEIYLDSSWRQEEQDAIVFGMTRLEEATGLNFFDFMGTYENEDGGFTLDDIDDNRHVVYKLTTPNETTEAVAEAYKAETGNGLGGYGLRSDILIYYYNSSGKDTPENRDNYLVYLANIVVHETGHFLGLGHNRTVACDESLMAPHLCPPAGEYEEITADDIAQLCTFYECP
jgi:hypothetical protein